MLVEYTARYRVVLYHSVLLLNVLCDTSFRWIMLHHATMCYIAPCSNLIQHNTVKHYMMQYITMKYDMLYCRMIQMLHLIWKFVNQTDIQQNNYSSSHQGVTCIADDESFLAPWLALWPNRRAVHLSPANAKEAWGLGFRVQAKA